MFKVKFRQAHSGNSLIFTLGYIAVACSFIFYYFGLTEVVDFANDANKKIVALLACVILLGPAVIIGKKTAHQYGIRIEKNMLSLFINGKISKHLDLKEIKHMRSKSGSMNSLNIYKTSNELILNVTPNEPAEAEEIITKITKAIQEKVEFRVSTTKQKNSFADYTTRNFYKV